MMSVSILNELTDADEDIIADIHNNEFKWKYAKYGFSTPKELQHEVNRLSDLNILEPINIVYAQKQGHDAIPISNQYKVTDDFLEMIRHNI